MHKRVYRVGCNKESFSKHYLHMHFFAVSILHFFVKVSVVCLYKQKQPSLLYQHRITKQPPSRRGRLQSKYFVVIGYQLALLDYVESLTSVEDYHSSITQAILFFQRLFLFSINVAGIFYDPSKRICQVNAC